MDARPATLGDWYNTSSDEEDSPPGPGELPTGRCSPSTCQHFTDQVATILRYSSTLSEPEERRNSRFIHAQRQQLLIHIEISTRRQTQWYHPALLIHAIELFPFVASYIRTMRVDDLVILWQDCPPPRANNVSARAFTRHLLDAIDVHTYLDRLGLRHSVDRTVQVRLNNFPMSPQDCRNCWQDSLRDLSPMCPLIILLFLCPRLYSLGIVHVSQQERFAILLGCLDVQVIRDNAYWQEAGSQVPTPGRLRMAPPALTVLAIGQAYGTASRQLRHLRNHDIRLTAERAIVVLTLPRLKSVDLCFLTGDISERPHARTDTVTNLMVRGAQCSYRTLAELTVVCARLHLLMVMFSFTAPHGSLGVEPHMLNISLREHAIARGADPARFAGRCLQKITRGTRYTLPDESDMWQEYWEWMFQLAPTTATNTAN